MKLIDYFKEDNELTKRAEEEKIEVVFDYLKTDFDDYLARFAFEYIELKIRLLKLKKMLLKWEQQSLDFTPSCPRELYTVQVDAMERYLGVLEARLYIEQVPENRYLDEVPRNR